MACSCSVKENRANCPSWLDLTVVSQYDFIFEDGKAWCSIYEESGERMCVSPLTEMNDRDTLLTYTIDPKRTVSAVVTSKEIINGAVTVPFGEEMSNFYAFRKDIACFDEVETDVIYKLHKQYCLLTVNLSEVAKPFAKYLTARVDAPYDGSSFPSFAAHKGDYRYKTTFDSEGKAYLRLPRQAGIGMTLTIAKEGAFADTYDLYEAMRMAHFDWTKDSLDDYEITVTLNGAGAEFEIEDWKVVDLGDKEF